MKYSVLLLVLLVSCVVATAPRWAVKLKGKTEAKMFALENDVQMDITEEQQPVITFSKEYTRQYSDYKSLLEITTSSDFVIVTKIRIRIYWLWKTTIIQINSIYKFLPTYSSIIIKFIINIWNRMNPKRAGKNTSKTNSISRN